MSYNYQTQKPFLFTDKGQRMFLKIRDAAFQLCDQAGAVSAMKLIHAAGTGHDWDMLACIDRLVEIGDIKELTDPNTVWAQHRVFVRIHKEA